MKRYSIFLYIFFCGPILQAQLPVGRDTITVIESGKVLKMPWAGGLNSCVFSQIDLNQDGKQDIVAFDKVNFFGFGILRCFINHGSAGQTNYVYDGSYNPKFPAVQYWAMFQDYNNDGKADLFTYSAAGGTAVYRNTSSGGILSFQLAKSVLKSNTTPSSTPNYGTIFANSISGPGISDIDNDGDLDLLVFSALGYQIEYHRNMSKESGWNADSLVFQLEESTWGDLSENNCVVSLNQYIAPQPAGGDNSNKAYHAGACLMCFDRDGDNDKDLIIGDLYCSVANYCENGGSISNAHISDTTKIYPNYPAKGNTQVIHMNTFPCTYNLDVDNDGKKDLIASPNTVNSENYTSVWYYKNMTTGVVADFRFVKNNFLQDEMIELGEGAYPVLFDVDNDNLPDLVVGNTGYYNGTPKPMLAYYRNTGTLSQPSYSLMTRDFFNLSVPAATYTLTGMVPTFGDVDGDGDNDMVIADYYGKFHLVQNTAGAGNPCNFSNFLPFNY
ncbi:MAG: FG-GAP repeat domain-containing protein, partial [Bacteroidia bacterium]